MPGEWMLVCCEYDAEVEVPEGPIPRPENSNQVTVGVFVCVS